MAWWDQLAGAVRSMGQQARSNVIDREGERRAYAQAQQAMSARQAPPAQPRNSTNPVTSALAWSAPRPATPQQRAAGTAQVEASRAQRRARNEHAAQQQWGDRMDALIYRTEQITPGVGNEESHARRVGAMREAREAHEGQIQRSRPSAAQIAERKRAVEQWQQEQARLSTAVRELTPEEYAALSREDQAAVQFNTGLVEASRADKKAGGTENTSNYLTGLGIQLKSEEELDAFLELDRAIDDAVRAQLGDVTLRRQDAESLRWARGNTAAAPEATRRSAARGDLHRASQLLSTLLGTTGQNVLSTESLDAPARPGYGGTPTDQVIQRAFTYMADSRWDMTPEDVAAGVAELNQQVGADATPEQVWEFARDQLEAAQFRRRGDGAGRLLLPETVDPETGEELVPLEIDEFRRRYGL